MRAKSSRVGSSEGLGTRSLLKADECLQGLVEGFSGLVKCLGLTNGELMGSDWPWEEAAERSEESRSKRKCWKNMEKLMKTMKKREKNVKKAMEIDGNPMKIDEISMKS